MVKYFLRKKYIKYGIKLRREHTIMSKPCLILIINLLMVPLYFIILFCLMPDYFTQMTDDFSYLSNKKACALINLLYNVSCDVNTN
jgi:hypothetical protein